MEDRGLVQMKGKGEVRTFWLVGATSKAIQKREVDTAELPPLFCRPRKSPNLNSRQASMCGGFASRRQSSVPRGASTDVESFSTNIRPSDSNSSLRVLRRIADRAPLRVSDPASSKMTLDAGALDRAETPPSLTAPFSAFAVCPLKCSLSLDQFPHRKRYDAQLIELKIPDHSRSLENCTDGIFLPLVNNNIPNGNVAGVEVAQDDIETPLLPRQQQQHHQTPPRIVRNRKRPSSEQFPEARPKRWHSLEEMVEPSPDPSPTGNGAAKTRSSIRWLVALLHGNGLRTSDASLRKAVHACATDVQQDRQSIV